MNDKELLKDTLAIVLAGGKGERLYPLTRDRAKPAVPFGGMYRIIDFTLSNCLNSGLRKIVVLTQYKSISLGRHLNLAWNIFNYQLGEFIISIPPQQRVGDYWYEGTADAVYQNIYTLDEVKPRFVLILSGDHVYTMDYREMLKYHVRKRADVTVGCVEVDRSEGRRMGIVEIDGTGRMTAFIEKPKIPKTIPGKKDKSLASMGVYVFNTETLVREVIRDKKAANSSHDFGKDVIPRMFKRDEVYGYSVSSYWRDVGTVDAYYRSNMDLLESHCTLDLNAPDWPIRTHMEQLPAAKVINGSRRQHGAIVDSILSPGCVIRGATVKHSILCYGVRVDEGSVVEDCVLLGKVEVGKRCYLKNTIIDKRVRVPDGHKIGSDRNHDLRNFTVTESGIVVVPKDCKI